MISVPVITPINPVPCLWKGIVAIEASSGNKFGIFLKGKRNLEITVFRFSLKS